MQRRSMIAEFEMLPLAHKLAAGTISLVIIAATVGISGSLPEVYTSSAMLSWNPAADRVASKQSGSLASDGSDRSGVSVIPLARSILSEPAQPDRQPDQVGPKAMPPDPAQPNLTPRASESEQVKEPALFRAHLTLTQVSDSKIRVSWQGADAAQTMAMTQTLTNQLASWTPRATKNPVSNGDVRQTQTSAPEVASSPNIEKSDQTASRTAVSTAVPLESPWLAATESAYPSANPSSRRFERRDRHPALVQAAYQKPIPSGREEMILGATLKVLDAKSTALQAQQDLAFKAAAGQPWPGPNKAMVDSIRRQLAVLQTQRLLIENRLSEEQVRVFSDTASSRIENSAAMSTRSRTVPTTNAKPRLVPNESTVGLDSGSKKRNEKSPTGSVHGEPAAQGEPLAARDGRNSPPNPFTILEPATSASPSVLTRSIVNTLGVFAALLCGLSYLAAALWRFRPVPNVSELKLHLPGEILFVGTIRGGRQ